MTDRSEDFFRILLFSSVLVRFTSSLWLYLPKLRLWSRDVFELFLKSVQSCLKDALPLDLHYLLLIYLLNQILILMLVSLAYLFLS